MCNGTLPYMPAYRTMTIVVEDQTNWPQTDEKHKHETLSFEFQYDALGIIWMMEGAHFIIS
jgi:hypothetical protein